MAMLSSKGFSIGSKPFSLELLEWLLLLKCQIFLLELELLLKGFLPLELLDSIDELVSVADSFALSVTVAFSLLDVLADSLSLLDEAAIGSEAVLSAVTLTLEETAFALELELDSFVGSLALELLLFSESFVLEDAASELELMSSSLSEEATFASELEETFFALELDDATFALELEEMPSASEEQEISVFFSESVELALTASLSQLAQKAAVRARTAFFQCLCKKRLMRAPSIKICSKNKKKTPPWEGGNV